MEPFNVDDIEYDRRDLGYSSNYGWRRPMVELLHDHTDGNCRLCKGDPLSELGTGATWEWVMAGG